MRVFQIIHVYDRFIRQYALVVQWIEQFRPKE